MARRARIEAMSIMVTAVMAERMRDPKHRGADEARHNPAAIGGNVDGRSQGYPRGPRAIRILRSGNG